MARRESERRAREGTASPEPTAENRKQVQANIAAESAGASADMSRPRSVSIAPAAAPAQQATEKIGTAHGQSETAYSRSTNFERATQSPFAVVAVEYDQYANLVNAGVIPVRRKPSGPSPFPNSGFVPDPPIR